MTAHNIQEPTTPGGRSVASGVIEDLTGGLVVSCQASAEHPLRAPHFIEALCRCAEAGGAVGVRVDGPEQVRVAKASTSLYVLGIQKVFMEPGRLVNNRPAITPGPREALALARAGADLVAVEATVDLHGDGAAEVVAQCRRETGLPVMADISTVSEGCAAYGAGADVVATTLSGYTRASPVRDAPGYQLVRLLADGGLAVAAEGGISSPKEAVSALLAGAQFVVVGRAITDPVGLTRDFAIALASWRDG